jgi:hypothetical protein
MALIGAGECTARFSERVPAMASSPPTMVRYWRIVDATPGVQRGLLPASKFGQALSLKT